MAPTKEEKSKHVVFDKEESNIVVEIDVPAPEERKQIWYSVSVVLPDVRVSDQLSSVFWFSFLSSFFLIPIRHKK